MTQDYFYKRLSKVAIQFLQNFLHLNFVQNRLKINIIYRFLKIQYIDHYNLDQGVKNIHGAKYVHFSKIQKL